MNKLNKDFWIAAGYRALRTFCQVLISMIAVGSAVTDVDWVNVLSVSAMAAFLSVLTSIATGLPEAEKEEEKHD